MDGMNDKQVKWGHTYYTSTRRMKIGNSANGQDITVRCYYDVSEDQVVLKYYRENEPLSEPQSVVQTYDAEFVIAFTRGEPNKREMKTAWCRFFGTIDFTDESPLDIKYNDRTKRIFIGKEDVDQIWMSWVRVNGEDYMRLFPSDTDDEEAYGTYTFHYDSMNLISQIHNKKYWKEVGNHLWMQRYGEPKDEYSSVGASSTIKRSASTMAVDGTNKKTEVESVWSACITTDPSKVSPTFVKRLCDSRTKTSVGALPPEHMSVTDHPASS